MQSQAEDFKFLQDQLRDVVKKNNEDMLKREREYINQQHDIMEKMVTSIMDTSSENANLKQKLSDIKCKLIIYKQSIIDQTHRDDIEFLDDVIKISSTD